MPYFNLTLACCGGLSPTTKILGVNVHSNRPTLFKSQPTYGQGYFFKQKTIQHTQKIPCKFSLKLDIMGNGIVGCLKLADLQLREHPTFFCLFTSACELLTYYLEIFYQGSNPATESKWCSAVLGDTTTRKCNFFLKKLFTNFTELTRSESSLLICLSTISYVRMATETWVQCFKTFQHPVPLFGVIGSL